MTINRTRWAALGAAVAVTAGAGGIGFVQAESAPTGSSFVSNVPCRMLDTRDVDSIGMIGAGEPITLQARGLVGECDIPENATGLSVNIAAVAASSDTFLTLFPSGNDVPKSSHLNVHAGLTTSNGVDVALSSDGNVDIYNDAGELHVIIDLLGAYVPGSGSGEPGLAGPEGPAGEDGPAGVDGVDGVSAFTLKQVEIELLHRDIFLAPAEGEAAPLEGPYGEFGYVGPLDVCEGGIMQANFVDMTNGYIEVFSLDDIKIFDEESPFSAPLGSGSFFGNNAIDVMVYVEPDFAAPADIAIDLVRPVTITTDIEVICVSAPVLDLAFDDVPDNDIEDDIFFARPS